jgi:hypothetical protein
MCHVKCERGHNIDCTSPTRARTASCHLKWTRSGVLPVLRWAEYLHAGPPACAAGWYDEPAQVARGVLGALPRLGCSSQSDHHARNHHCGHRRQQSSAMRASCCASGGRERCTCERGVEATHQLAQHGAMPIRLHNDACWCGVIPQVRCKSDANARRPPDAIRCAGFRHASAGLARCPAACEHAHDETPRSGSRSHQGCNTKSDGGSAAGRESARRQLSPRRRRVERVRGEDRC